MLNKPCGHAAHVDSVDRLRLPTLPTIAWTSLRLAHMTTRQMMIFWSAKRTTTGGLQALLAVS